jgi:hypothetical protein
VGEGVFEAMENSEKQIKQIGIEKLLALRGKIRIDFDWEGAEAEEIKAAEECVRRSKSSETKATEK